MYVVIVLFWREMIGRKFEKIVLFHLRQQNVQMSAISNVLQPKS